jgi:hypothetical protein
MVNESLRDHLSSGEDRLHEAAQGRIEPIADVAPILALLDQG